MGDVFYIKPEYKKDPIATIADAVEMGDKDVKNILQNLLDNYEKIKCLMIGVRLVDSQDTDLLHNQLLRDTKIAIINDMEKLNDEYSVIYFDEEITDDGHK